MITLAQVAEEVAKHEITEWREKREQGLRWWACACGATSPNSFTDHIADVVRRMEHPERPVIDRHEAIECAHHSWAGLMELLDQHWPAETFPTREDDLARDAGARIVSLLRWVDQLKTQLRDEPLRGGQDFTFEPFPGLQYLCQASERAPEQFRALAAEPTAWLMLRHATPVPAVPARVCGVKNPIALTLVCELPPGHTSGHRSQRTTWHGGTR